MIASSFCDHARCHCGQEHKSIHEQRADHAHRYGDCQAQHEDNQIVERLLRYAHGERDLAVIEDRLYLLEEEEDHTQNEEADDTDDHEVPRR